MPPRRSLFFRVWNRARGLPFIGPRLYQLEDFSNQLRFSFLDTSRKEQLLAECRGCRTPEQYVAFANKLLGSHQIPAEIAAFLASVQELQPRRVLEIGTAFAGTTFLLCQALPEVKQVIGMDLHIRNKTILRFFVRSGQNVCLLEASSHSGKTQERLSRLLAGELLDLLFIDGDHTYQGVKKDFLQYRHFVRKGGSIAFHDIIPDYKTRFGKSTGRWAGQVPVLWSEIRGWYPTREFVEDPGQDGLGIGVLTYDPAVALSQDWERSDIPVSAG